MRRATTLMLVVWAGLKVGLYKMFENQYWLKRKIKVLGFKNH